MNRYWIDGSGDWTASDTTHWSETSGGSGGASVPVSTNTVRIDSNSGSGTINLLYEPTIYRLIFNNYTGLITNNGFYVTTLGGRIRPNINHTSRVIPTTTYTDKEGLEEQYLIQQSGPFDYLLQQDGGLLVVRYGMIYTDRIESSAVFSDRIESSSVFAGRTPIITTWTKQ